MVAGVFCLVVKQLLGVSGWLSGCLYVLCGCYVVAKVLSVVKWLLESSGWFLSTCYSVLGCC